MESGMRGKLAPPQPLQQAWWVPLECYWGRKAHYLTAGLLADGQGGELPLSTCPFLIRCNPSPGPESVSPTSQPGALRVTCADQEAGCDGRKGESETLAPHLIWEQVAPGLQCHLYPPRVSLEAEPHHMCPWPSPFAPELPDLPGSSPDPSCPFLSLPEGGNG